MPTRNVRVRPLSVSLAMLFLAACAGAPGVRSGKAPAPPAGSATVAGAEAKLTRGELPQAALEYRQAAVASDDERIAEQATRVAYDNHQLREAALAADRWLAINPTSEQAHRYAGMSALRLHRLERAEAEFAELISTVYISPAAGFLALLPVIGDEALPTDVAEVFRRLSARHPKVAEGHFAYGSTALRAENYAVALAEAQRATELAPYWTPARLLQARATIATGKEEEGLAMARDLVMAPDSEVATHIDYALLLGATGHDEEARAMLTPYASGQTVIPGAVRTLGAMDLDAGKLDSAGGYFETLLSTGSQSYEALYYLGALAERRKDPEQARRYYSRVASGEYAMPAQQRLARLLADAGGLDAGLQSLQEYGRAQPAAGPQVAASRAALASAMGDDKRSLALLDKSLLQYPDSVDLRMQRVYLNERMGNTEAAIREQRELLRERPGDAMLQNSLGYTLADHGQRLGEANELVTAALRQSPDSAAFLDSMGWVLHKQGRSREAIAYLQRARNLSSDPEIDLHLGEAQWASGERDAARTTWRKALEAQPDNAKLQERLKQAGR
jgi:tetratricopeptide (TPR) repeat protein